MTVEQTRSRRAMDRIGLLLARHGGISNARMRQALEATGLTMRQGITLMHLAETGPIGQQALMEALKVDPSALVAILNDLERDNLVERRRDPADRRRHIVAITEAGTSAVTRVDTTMSAVERELLAHLDPDEIATLHTLLARINTSVNDEACAES
ncbi:MarR family transcriptional regulator [Micromonospora pisi]|uniref:MarR family transcriptional regulator n=1 Tax=Micromonospora pisi TaxID=589240 RepID=A0A495JGZ5_9ACTN|nr:MarR family winged helix-turn-helix transcriptional regulator [Micromonospora pisi]RKR87838.1 MarR family transcriptional regulator [Micromonospora pisi]